ncbi:hypothetical protein BT63DRAFT_421709 [Microthyrium microscopicum]|uniref:Transcription initiation factor TFIID subunit 4 n=1 Tax=Microthyrium microscopicum TaxID=703497 RepID=A0A6A6UP73_9PEZI|nr:hypothetical protein BT63DRAFT_421709 [Microthyrium microscopicum]
MTEHMNPPLPPSSMSNMAGQPPAKRPRLTTDFPGQTSTPIYGPPFPSPGLSSYSSNSLPPSPYQSFSPPQPIQPTPTSAYNPTMPRTPSGVMGPPERPKADRATNINELSDALFAAGVNIAEEERLAMEYGNNQFASFGTSFGHSQGSSHTITPESWSQSSTAAQFAQSSRPNGSLGDPDVTLSEFERQVQAEHYAAAKRQAELKAIPMNDAFLQINTVRNRIHNRTTESQVFLKQDGVTVADARSSHAHLVTGPPGSNGALVRAQVYTLNETSSMVDLFSLISLATQQRLRDVMEDAYATARARQYGSGGVVPPEWADIATGSTNAEKTTVRPQAISGTAWETAPDSAVSPMTVVPAKRPHDDSSRTRPPTPPPEPEVAPVPTIRYPPRLPIVLRELGTASLAQERKRVEARKKRQLQQAKKDQDSAMETDDATESPNPGTPNSASTPSVVEPKITKKEREKLNKDKQTEEVLRQQANQTAALALGGLGGGKKYSWLTPGARSGGGGTGAGQRDKLAKKALGIKKEKAAPPAPTEDPALASKKSYQSVGLLKETPGIQLRDILNVIEREAKESRVLLRGYSRLGNSH